MKNAWNAYKKAALKNPDWFVGCYLGVCVLFGIATGSAIHYKQKAEEYRVGLHFVRRALEDAVANCKKED